MPKAGTILNDVKDEAFALAAKEFKDLLKEAKSDARDLIKKNGEKLENWLNMLANGKLDEDEFEALIRARKRTMRQYVNTLEIKQRKRAKKVSLDLLNLALKRIVPIILAAI